MTTDHEMIQRLHQLIEIEQLFWSVLEWIDTFEPETTAAAEAKFGFDLQNRTVTPR